MDSKQSAHIVAVESALPATEVTNEELARKHPEWEMDQVVQRTGVESRRWCVADETSLDLAEMACLKLAERTGFDLQQIRYILFCTQSPDHRMPPNACLLQHRLGLSFDVAAMDFTLACSGYIYGLHLAKALVESALAENVLLVTSETYSKLMNRSDRGPATLFGDGAAATLVSSGFWGLRHFMLATDGGRANRFWIPGGGCRRPSSDETRTIVADEFGNLRSDEELHMNGPGVFDFVKKEVPNFVRKLLHEPGLTLDDVDLVLFHQASKIVVEFLYKALRVPVEKQYTNLARTGNVVSASLPILLRDAEKSGVLREGMRVLLVGFGVGMSWGGCVIAWE